MNTRSQRLKSLIRIAAHQREQAAQQLADARRRRDQADATLGLLRMHFEDYRQRLNQPRPAGSMARLREFQYFVHRLGQAMEQQQHALEQAERLCQQQHQAFLKKHSRYRALEQACERLEIEESRQRDKYAQLQLAEISTLRRLKQLK